MTSDPIAAIHDSVQYVHGCIVMYRIQLIKDYKTIQSPKESHYIYQLIKPESYHSNFQLDHV
jgi:hypothetical protein